ncbi:hypothetical protein MHK_000080 [Candidatus Magnetomorum sp. HK-1]|nr:hypothetical protein MHK_000080 [Candidatus Magnetomorum sp. HK-1]
MIVRDKTPPVVELIGQTEVTVNVHTEYIDQGATFIDNYDGTSELSDDHFISTVNINVIGTYAVVYLASDSSGNQSEEVTRTVNVVDSVKPEIQLNSERISKHIIGTDYHDQTTATDNYDGNITQQLKIEGNVDIQNEGTYILIYNVSDSSENQADEAVRHVVVYKKSEMAPEGHIYNELGQPLENVIVSLVDDSIGYTTMSTTDGYYQYKPLALNNSYYLHFSKTGYETTVLAFYGQTPLNDIVLIEKESTSFMMLTGVCYSNDKPLQGVSVKLTHSDYSVMALSDESGMYTIMYNPSIDFYHLTATKNGFHSYVKDSLKILDNEKFNISLPPKTAILVENIPVTNQGHQAAKLNNAVIMRIQALPNS